MNFNTVFIILIILFILAILCKDCLLEGFVNSSNFVKPINIHTQKYNTKLEGSIINLKSNNLKDYSKIFKPLNN